MPQQNPTRLPPLRPPKLFHIHPRQQIIVVFERQIFEIGGIHHQYAFYAGGEGFAISGEPFEALETRLDGWVVDWSVSRFREGGYAGVYLFVPESS